MDLSRRDMAAVVICWYQFRSGERDLWRRSSWNDELSANLLVRERGKDAELKYCGVVLRH